MPLTTKLAKEYSARDLHARASREDGTYVRTLLTQRRLDSIT